MSLFYWTVPYIAVLTVVVFIHELGHFLVGRLCGAKVDAFSVGFGPELFHFIDRWGTRWRVAALPLGGYVKFHGDANGASVPDAQALADMPPEERSGTLAGLSVWRRAAIVAAGPAANFVLALVILSSLFHFYGRPIVHPQVQQVLKDSAAATVGLKAGDVILALDGQEIESVDQLPRLIRASDGPVSVLVQRGSAQQTFVVTPDHKSIPTWLGTEHSATLGVAIVGTKANLELRRYPPLQAVKVGAEQVWSIVEITGHTIKQLIVGRESVRQLSGPIGIAQVSAEAAQAGIVHVTFLLALLSISVGLLNLLPIPLLDGGFLMFFAYEAVRGKALPERAQMVGFRIGLTFVAVLSVFVAVNDISKLLFSATGQSIGTPASSDQKK